MNLVVTMAMGWWADEIIEVSCPSFKLYAEKIKADLKIITEKKINIPPLYMEKFQVYDMFNDYDRILLLDCDILIHPKCPNLFEIVPENCLGAVPDCDKGEWWNTNYYYDMGLAQKDLGYIGWEYGYFNSGVLVLSKMHKEIFAAPEEALKMTDWFHDQLLINYRFQKMYLENRSGFFCLPTKFNAMRLSGYIVKNGNTSMLSAYILHFASHKKKAKLMEWCWSQLKNG
jgi:lipopolysaccharide biosynthesis glycosyltransferase